MAAAAFALRPRLARQAAPLFVLALALAYAIAAIAAVNGSIGARPFTTYGAGSVFAHAADLGAGLALLAAGAVAWWWAVGRWLGSLAMLLAAVWFAPDLEGWQRYAVVRSLGAVLAVLFLAILFHLVLAAPAGRLRGQWTLASVTAAYAVTVFIAVGRALFRDPFLDPNCWRNCSDNIFLVHADQGIAHDLDVFWSRASAAIGVLAVAVAGLRLAGASRPARRVLAPILVPAAVIGTAEAAYAAALLHTPLEDPRNPMFFSLFLARSLALAALAVGVLWTVSSARRTRAAIARLTDELDEAPPPGKLREALAGAVGDPGLRVAYWLETSRRFVGADGRPLPAPAPEPGRAVTPIVRSGRPLAVVTHDATLVDTPGLEREIGSAARLAVENERLQAEVLAQLEDLRRSRARIVERGDAERRRLERNLHDGAQQRLLALSYDLRLARAEAEGEGDAELTALLTSAAEDAQDALGELRELAHGIYPAILAEAGLGPALATLAEEAPLPIELGEIPQDRYSASIETAAYLAIAEAVDDAADRRATSVRVDMKRVDERVLLLVEDDGAARRSSLGHVADRIGALGGSLDVGPTTLAASIPCA